MNEPTAPILITGVVASALSTVLGYFSLLLFSAIVGALLAMSKEPLQTRCEGLKFLAVSVGISFVLTSAAVWAVEKYTSIPGHVALMPVSFFFAMSRQFLLGFVQSVIGAASNFVIGFFGKKGG